MAGRARTSYPSEQLRSLLDRYVHAFETADVEGLVATLQHDATYSMPPWWQWFVGAEAIAGFFQRVWQAYAGVRLFPTGANAQPAFATYTRA